MTTKSFGKMLKGNEDCKYCCASDHKQDDCWKIKRVRGGEKVEAVKRGINCMDYFALKQKLSPCVQMKRTNNAEESVMLLIMMVLIIKCRILGSR